MNNARYVREMDFARMHFYKRTGLYEMLFNKDGTSLQAAAHIRYRRPIVVLTPYKVTTRIMYWDKRNIYFEQQFITLSDGFVAAVAVCKQTILGMNVIEIMNKLLGNKNETDHPTPPPELEDFIHLNEKSSARLRKQNHVT
ncbi:THEM6, partial [Asbolus verrucosus]